MKWLKGAVKKWQLFFHSPFCLQKINMKKFDIVIDRCKKVCYIKCNTESYIFYTE